MLKKPVLAAVTAIISSFIVSVGVSAAPYTSPDGVLSIELPNENWKPMNDSSKWVVLSDGANMITAEHYSNGEALPAMSIANDHYVDVYQAVISTQNEVFIVTGSVVDAAKIPEVCNAIISSKILKYDTKLAVKKNTAASNTGEFSIVPMNAVYYVDGDGINVRAGYSTSDAIIGGLGSGRSVNVTGKVQRGGADYGWYQISYEGKTGYVSSAFLTETAPTSGSGSGNSESSSSFTGRVRTIYEIDGHAVTVYESSDGYWYDNDGMKYSQITDYDFEAANGAPLSVNKPNLESAPAGDSFTVFWMNGNTTDLTLYDDGYYYSSDWVRYTWNGDGTYSGADGSTLYSTEPTLDTQDDSLVQCPYCGDWLEAGAIFRNHNCPEKEAALHPENDDIPEGGVEWVDQIYLSGGLVLSSFNGSTYIDDVGNTYWQLEDGGWTCGDGNVFYPVG